MTYDYSRAARLAQRLIDRFGRTVSLVKPSSALLVPSRPWRGPDTDPDPGETITDFRSVVVTPNQVRIFDLPALGDASEFENLVKFTERIYVLFPGNINVSEYTHVLDQNSRYGISATQTLTPGETSVLAYIGARR